MKSSENDHVYDEEMLNPPPRAYRVSPQCKAWFLLFSLCGLGVYIFMVASKRINEQQFISENQMAAIKLSPTPIPSSFVFNNIKDNAIVDLSKERGSWILMNIWATWCPPCREEMPGLALLQQKFADRLKVIAISVDDDRAPVLDFVSVNKPGFVVLWDQEKVLSKTFGIDRYPETFLVSPDGLLIKQLTGPRDWASPVAIDYFSRLLEPK